MDAKALCLFHFSQRYPKVPAFDRSPAIPVFFSFDFMRVSLKRDLTLAPIFLPALANVFSEEISDIMSKRDS